MAMRKTYEIAFSEDADEHLDFIERKYHSLVLDTIEKQLTHQPLVEMRNRKPIRQPAVYPEAWEIRFGPNNRFRVFYEVDVGRQLVSILAIGCKERNRLVIGGDEIQLSLG